MNKYKRLLGDSIVFGIGNFVTKLIYFFLMPIYTTTLSPADFGLADLLSNSLSLITPIFTLCIADGVFRFVLDKDSDSNKILSDGGYVWIRSTIIVGIITLVIYWFDTQFYWILFGILYSTEALRLLFAHFTRGLGKSKIFALNGIIGALVLISLSYITLKYWHLGVNGYLISLIVSNISSCIYLFIYSRLYRFISLNTTDFNLLKKMLIYSLPLIPNMLSWWITNISSRYIIAGYCGLALAGFFSAASKLPALINIMGSIFQQAWQYASVKEYQESNKSEFYSIVFNAYSCLILLGSTIIIILIPYISKLVLKDEFYQAWIYTPLLLFSAMLGCYSLFLGTFYAVIKDNKKAMYTTLMGSIVSLAICFLLIPIIGIYGALIANVAGFSIIVYMRFYHVRKMITLNVNFFQLILSLIIVLIISVFITLNLTYSLYVSIISLCLIIFIQGNEISLIITKVLKYIAK